MNHGAKTARELDLRSRFGIPEDAAKILVFCESSHWDPDWLYTSEKYYRRFIQKNLDQALAALQDDPRRIYSIECMFFLRMYWERNPQKHSLVRDLINSRRLRLTGSGVTTADTLLPSEEAILRDFLIGQEWLRQNGMKQEPSLAYFSDSFGCTPFLPSLLQAAGFDRTAITRIDGMYFPGADLDPSWWYPRPGSTAAQLLQKEHSLDFIWRDANQAEVLCHWNAFTYGHGDLLTSRGAARVYLFPFSIPDSSERNIARRVNQYIQKLAPHSRTPYLLCPIGFDFVSPIPKLVALLDRYNRIRYPHTGTWLVNAGLDDYLDLVETHRDVLPILEIDPNPYWTGFYTSRPALKDRCYELVDKLLCIERLSLLPENHNRRDETQKGLDPAWWIAATSNHHDFITGTSPDSVVETEQMAWLDRADEIAEKLLSQQAVIPNPTQAVLPTGGTLNWHLDGNIYQVESPDYCVNIPAGRGGAISFVDKEQTEYFNDIISYEDSGGLWRMGHEFAGGFLRERTSANVIQSPVLVHENSDCLEFRGQTILDGRVLQRSLRFYPGIPLIFGNITGTAAPRKTICLRFHSPELENPIWMVQPGGIAKRPLQKIFRPTFWPMQAFAAIPFSHNQGGMILLSRTPTAVAAKTEGRIDLIAIRNATRERAFGFLRLASNPAKGHEKNMFSFDYAFGFSHEKDLHLVANSAYASFESYLAKEKNEHTPCARSQLQQNQVVLETCNKQPGDVRLIAFKPAQHKEFPSSEEVILRLSTYTPPQKVRISLHRYKISVAFLCDSRERNLVQLPVQDGIVNLDMPGAIITLRLRISEIE